MKCRCRAAIWLALSLVAVDATAQSPSDKATARILGTEGLRLAEAGDCEAAIEKLKRAEELYHAPTTLGRLGECQLQVGKLVAGTENLQRVIREPLPATASPAFRAAKQRAKRVLDQALPKIGMLQINVETSLPNAEFVVKVDGEEVPAAIIGAKRPTDPGERLVEASGPHCSTEQQRVTLAEGGDASVSLSLECEPPPEPPKPPPPPVGTGQPSPAGGRPEAESDDTLAYVALGVGGAGLVAGSVFGLMAMGEKSTLQDDCNDDRKCPGTSQDNLDNLDRYALFSNVGFGVGIVGVGVGTTLLLLSNDPAPPSVDAGAKATGPSVQPYIGAGAAGLTGTF